MSFVMSARGGQLQLWVFVVMAVAALSFIAVGRPAAALIVAIAGTAYFVMHRSEVLRVQAEARGDEVGAAKAADRTLTARYTDWLFTTPIILVLLLAGRMPSQWVALAAGADALMIVTGYLGSLEASQSWRMAWFTLSTALFIVPLVSLTHCLGSPKYKNASAAILTILVWLLYPVLWLLQYYTLSLAWDTVNAWTAVLDVVAKVGLGILLAE